MLLYTRLAAPKAPKRRSRAGCNYCKEKKKKCDEARPNCSRCQEHRQSCTYEAVKPRQRRRQDAADVSALATPVTHSITLNGYPAFTRPKSEDENQNSDEETVRDEAHFSALAARDDQEPADEPDNVSLTWTPVEVPESTPGDSQFDYGRLDDPADDDDVEEIIRFGPEAPPDTAPCTDLAPTSPASTASPIFEFCAPAWAEFSEQTNRRALIDHFCNVLSHLIVLREDNGNPFQQLVLPLSYNSQAVTGAILALASAHLEFRGVQNTEKSVYFHNQAIQGLARLIEQGENVNKNELLAAIMLLVYYEVLVQQGRSNIVDGHLKGAMAIMGNSAPRKDATGAFLERAFRFYDVIAALSFGTTPHSTAQSSGSMVSFPAQDPRATISPAGSVDALLGMATTLWPIIHRLSSMQELRDELDEAVSHGEVSKAAVLRTEFDTTASAIEDALQQWQPVLAPDSVLNKDPKHLPEEEAAERGRLQSIINTALAYRHSAFVYLYHTTYRYPRSHALVQRHAHASLIHCVGTVSNEGPMGALLWPLFVAACEATSLGDRDLARQAFVGIDRRQGMTNIQRAWCIVQEVWRRADAVYMMKFEDEFGEDMLGGAQKGDLWRRVSGDMGMTIVFG